jgi:hypothetical protein
MKKIAGFVAVAVLMASAASAGGPVVVVDEGEPIAVAPVSSVSPALLIGGLAGAALLASVLADDDDETEGTPETPAE